MPVGGGIESWARISRDAALENLPEKWASNYVLNEIEKSIIGVFFIPTVGQPFDSRVVYSKFGGEEFCSPEVFQEALDELTRAKLLLRQAPWGEHGPFLYWRGIVG